MLKDKLVKEEYEFMWADENEVYLDLEPMMLNHGKNAIRRFGFGLKNALAYNHGFVTEFYIPRKELTRLEREGYKFFTNSGNLKKLLHEIDLSIGKIRSAVSDAVKYDLAKASNQEFVGLWSSYIKTIVDVYTCYSMTQPSRTAGLEKRLNIFVNDSEISKKQETISLLTKPERTIHISKNQNDLLKSFSETVKGENYKINRELASSSLYAVEITHEKKRDELIKKFGIPQEINKISRIIGILASSRLEMRLNWIVLNYFHEMFIEEIKRRLKISKEEVRLSSFNELNYALLGKRNVDINKITIRSKGVVKILKNGKIIEIEWPEANVIMNIIKKPKKNTAKIKGTVASKGLAKGKVLVLSYRDADKHSEKIQRMNQGDILVTEMTHPNIISACKKAGGIITDEGGLLSHAAIVSREFNIPCIIGTKFATQILKDGDLVVLDANNGEVTKILWGVRN